ncbi:MAG: threonine synthase [Acidobacteria bacterium]|nr:MAG: threonine synthase [Acidobacteriota bacterium]
MAFVIGLRCKECGERYAAGRQFVCSSCFGPLEVEYDYAAIGRSLGRESIAARPRNLWRYRELLPIEGDPATGRHSGFTPLVRARRLGEAIGLAELYLKDDSVNHPTLSYKERVVSVAITRALELGFDTIACASTGNLANSVAAHSARLGLRCFVFVPDAVEPAKIVGSGVYRPRIVRIRGNYDDVNRLCSEIGSQYSWGFVNVNLRPYYTEGAKTMGFEIAEQLDWRLPRHTILPTAGGTLLPKVCKAYQELVELGWVEGESRIHAAQAAGCAPVIAALHAGKTEIRPVKPATIAHSIAIGNPADGRYVLDCVRRTGGWGETATDPEILDSIQLLAESEGIFAEPAGGTTLAVCRKLVAQGRIRGDESVVVAITGNGYKATEAILPRLDRSIQLSSSLADFEHWYATLGASASEPVSVQGAS